MVDLLEDVFSNPRKENADKFQKFAHAGIEATTEVSKSKGKQAVNDFVVNRCSQSPHHISLIHVTNQAEVFLRV